MELISNYKHLTKINDSKIKYRSHLGIISDILSIIMEEGRHGAIVSSIARRTNLSHESAIGKCQELINAGLLEDKSKKRNRIFVITESGIQFFHLMQKFLESLKSINLSY